MKLKVGNHGDDELNFRYKNTNYLWLKLYNMHNASYLHTHYFAQSISWYSFDLSKHA
jgi:hypothetical protein